MSQVQNSLNVVRKKAIIIRQYRFNFVIKKIKILEASFFDQQQYSYGYQNKPCKTDCIDNIEQQNRV